ncbi:hypothetical protein MmiHf6_17100 [Methanimicrococcus hongohii]|uniref:Uncharacterized protein n=1 Tax=Methanimicrococcus hongohii TaxID=3028295 RepID=A0AA96ZTC6_9EURY|nr:hypothetical protein [Methanimicrococcus sp. Hf6]WNY24379.1 hypothetical protein MmiHf6_17100 [Methanimicrococcus sp. Hf6]
MQCESFSEIFRYVGQAPEFTPEKKEEIEKMVKRAEEEMKQEIQRIRKGIQLDGTKYPEEDLIKIRAMFGEIEE